MFWYVQKHKISTVGTSMNNTDVQIFGVSSQHIPFSASLWNHWILFHPMYVYVLWSFKINVTFGGDLKVITLFCREFWYCRNYALFVLICWAKKCACAAFYAFCMSVLHSVPLNVQQCEFYSRYMGHEKSKSIFVYCRKNIKCTCKTLLFHIDSIFLKFGLRKISYI